MDEERQKEEYVANTGREPTELPEDHPYRWQWEYRGTKAERESLLDRLGILDEEVPIVIEGQEEMF